MHVVYRLLNRSTEFNEFFWESVTHLRMVHVKCCADQIKTPRKILRKNTCKIHWFVTCSMLTKFIWNVLGARIWCGSTFDQLLLQVLMTIYLLTPFFLAKFDFYYSSIWWKSPFSHQSQDTLTEGYPGEIAVYQCQGPCYAQWHGRLPYLAEWPSHRNGDKHAPCICVFVVFKQQVCTLMSCLLVARVFY